MNAERNGARCLREGRGNDPVCLASGSSVSLLFGDRCSSGSVRGLKLALPRWNLRYVCGVQPASAGGFRVALGIHPRAEGTFPLPRLGASRSQHHQTQGARRKRQPALVSVPVFRPRKRPKTPNGVGTASVKTAETATTRQNPGERPSDRHAAANLWRTTSVSNTSFAFFALSRFSPSSCRPPACFVRPARILGQSLGLPVS